MLESKIVTKWTEMNKLFLISVICLHNLTKLCNNLHTIEHFYKLMTNTTHEGL